MARQEILERLADSHEAQIKKTLENLEADIISGISKATNDDNILTTKISIDLRKDLKQYMEQYRIDTDTLVRDYDQIVNSFMEEFGQLNIPDKFKSLTEVDLLTINQLKFQSFSGFEEIANRYLTEISANVYQNAIAGKPFNEMVKDIRGLITGDVDRRGRSMSTYASQIAHDSVMQFDGQFTVFKAKEAGLDKYKYTGTLVRDSRDHCRLHIGKTYTEDRIREIWQGSWAGKSEGDPFIVRGGYRCRHTWIPVVELEEDVIPEEEETPTSIFGKVSDDEKDLLNEGFGNKVTSVSKVISILPPLKQFKASGRGEYRGGKGDILNTGGLRKTKTFIHEYGHRIDEQLIVLFKDNKNLDLWEKLSKNSKVLGTLYSRELSQVRSVATLTADNIVEDAKSLSKNLSKRKLAFYNEKRKATDGEPLGTFRDQKRIDATKKYYKNLSDNETSILSDQEIIQYLKSTAIVKGVDFNPTNKMIYFFKLQLKHKYTHNQFSETFQDFVGAITKEAIGFGHGKAYYNSFPKVFQSGQRVITEGQTAEAFAQHLTMNFQADKNIRIIENKLMKHFAPNVKGGYDNVFKEFNKL